MPDFKNPDNYITRVNMNLYTRENYKQGRPASPHKDRGQQQLKGTALRTTGAAITIDATVHFHNCIYTRTHTARTPGLDDSRGKYGNRLASVFLAKSRNAGQTAKLRL